MSFGALSLLPPLIAIVVALVTGRTLLSIFIGVWLGATMLHHWNPLVGFARSLTDFVIPSIADEFNASLLVLVSVVGGFVYLFQASGAAEAFAHAVTGRIRTKRGAQTATWGSAFLFSFTEPCLLLGAVMRPVTDRLQVPRVKLAYILDSMGSALASFSPISSYGPFLVGLLAAQISALGLSDDPWSMFVQMLPYNLYGLFAMVTVLAVVAARLDIGPMRAAEKRASETGQVIGDQDKPLVRDAEFEFPDTYRFGPALFLVPLICLFGGILVTILWSGDVVHNGLRGAFLEADVILAITVGFLVGAMGAAFPMLRRRTRSLGEVVDDWVSGVTRLVMVPMILILAWSIGSVTTEMQVGEFLSDLVGDTIPVALAPVALFVLGGIIAFATGSSWGVWAIMIPIAVPLAEHMEFSVPLAVGAVVSGGLFGDHCSPISDTTIMSSTGAACDHIQHVRTQLPYALVVAGGAMIGFLATGLAGSPLVGIAICAAVIGGVLFLLSRSWRVGPLAGANAVPVDELEEAE